MTEFKVGDRVRILSNNWTIPVGAVGTVVSHFWDNDDVTAYGIVVDEEFQGVSGPFDWCLRVGGPYREFERLAPTDQEIQDTIDSILKPNV